MFCNIFSDRHDRTSLQIFLPFSPSEALVVSHSWRHGSDSWANAKVLSKGLLHKCLTGTSYSEIGQERNKGKNFHQFLVFSFICKVCQTPEALQNTLSSACLLVTDVAPSQHH